MKKKPKKNYLPLVQFPILENSNNYKEQMLKNPEDFDLEISF